METGGSLRASAIWSHISARCRRVPCGKSGSALWETMWIKNAQIHAFSPCKATRRRAYSSSVVRGTSSRTTSHHDLLCQALRFASGDSQPRIRAQTPRRTRVAGLGRSGRKRRLSARASERTRGARAPARRLGIAGGTLGSSASRLPSRGAGRPRALVVWDGQADRALTGAALRSEPSPAPPRSPLRSVALRSGPSEPRLGAGPTSAQAGARSAGLSGPAGTQEVTTGCSDSLARLRPQTRATEGAVELARSATAFRGRSRSQQRAHDPDLAEVDRGPSEDQVVDSVVPGGGHEDSSG